MKFDALGVVLLNEQQRCHFLKFIAHLLPMSTTGGDISTYFLTGTCHFARKIGTHNSVNSGGF